MPKRLLVLLASLLFVPWHAASAATEPAEPTVEAVFREWLEAFNSGDRAAIKAFYAERLGDPDAVFPLEVAEDSCGFDLARVESRSELSLSVLLAERC